jgi:hypothetical protein
VAEFYRFRQLSRDLSDVTEQIRRPRPVEERLMSQKKKRPKRSKVKSPKT